MIGLHFWLKVRPWYARLQPTALVVAVLVPFYRYSARSKRVGKLLL